MRKRYLPVVCQLAAAAVVAALAALSPSQSFAHDIGITHTHVSETATANRYELAVEGMSCAMGCPPFVKEVLESVDGVAHAEVSFDDKHAVVEMKPGHTLDLKACNQAFADSGYSISAIKESSAGQPASSSDGT